MENNPEVIDLTQSFIYCRAPTINLCDSIIDLDDSIVSDIRPPPTANRRLAEAIAIECEADVLPAVNITTESQPKQSTATKKKKRSRTSGVSISPVGAKSPRLGDCPICRDPLGTHPMASTKCGHVYCIKCIDQSVKIEKKCPTCRKPLKGPTAYHPLFL